MGAPSRFAPIMGARATTWATCCAIKGTSTKPESRSQRALEFAPQSGQACYNLALVLQEQERLDEAADAYGRAIRMGVDAPEAHENAGAVLCALGRFAEAETALRRAVEKRPQSARAHNLAECAGAYAYAASAEEMETVTRLTRRRYNTDFSRRGV